MSRYVLGLGAFGGSSDIRARKRLAELEARILALDPKAAGVRESACEKARAGGLLTRSEAAAFLSVSTKKLYRMEAAGTLARCPGLGSVVRYAARDVLRLAEASCRKGA